MLINTKLHSKTLYIIVFIIRGCFDRTHGLNKLFLHLMRALLLLNHDKLSPIFSCILLIRNHMIFLVQFGINKRLLVFSKTTNCTRPTGSCNFVSLWNNLLVLIYSKLYSKSCDCLYKLCFNLHTRRLNTNKTGACKTTTKILFKKRTWLAAISLCRNRL